MVIGHGRFQIDEHLKDDVAINVELHRFVQILSVEMLQKTLFVFLKLG